MFSWFKKRVNKESVQEPEVDDVTQTRDVREKIANVKLGNAFGLTTRDGIKIFKLIEIKSHPKKDKT